MRKFLIFIIITLTLLCRATAVETKTDTLSKIESSVLGIEYADQKLETRLNRLEEFLYGKIQNGNSKTRLAKIIETTKYNLLEEDNTIAGAQDEFEPLDSSVDYPVIDDVEKKLGIKSQKKDTLNSRLANIETKMFSSTYNNDDFFTRVERIKSKLYNGSSLAYDSESDEFAPPQKQSFFNNGSMNVRYKLSLLEQRLLKNTFGDETNNDRLARLENVVFDTQFYNDDEHERLDRLESALKAKKSSPKYDSNKFQQGLSTAMQIGAMVLMVLAFIL